MKFALKILDKLIKFVLLISCKHKKCIINIFKRIISVKNTFSKINRLRYIFNWLFLLKNMLKQFMRVLKRRKEIQVLEISESYKEVEFSNTHNFVEFCESLWLRIKEDNS